MVSRFFFSRSSSQRRSADARPRPRHRQPHLDDSLTGGERQPHEAGVVDGHDLVSDAELAGASRRAAVHHVGQDNRRQYGTPARLHDHHPEDLAFALLELQLRAEKAREEETMKSRSNIGTYNV